ncbi:helix-turn-helix domain-containing protein [Streptomyces gilvosporeus]|uniref:helix-turn-helix domain-containing protein n=1 Tax=Streptomyces gilvosporeus TaxID=553510 RepID=UPI0034086099
MPQTTDIGTGARIAAYRRMHHLTQRGLAAKANVSYSLLSKVESGHAPASAALTAACARVLQVPVTVLNGQPYATDHANDRLDGPLSDLRASLDNWDLALDVPVRSLDEIGADVRKLVSARRSANFTKIVSAVPPLIDELVQLSQTLTGHAQEMAHHHLVQVYRSAHDVAYGLGLTDLAALLRDRMEFSTRRAGDPYLMSLYHYMRAQSTFSTGRHEVGQRIVDIARDEIADGVSAGCRAAICAAGNLNLRASILHTRQGNGDGAREALGEARRLARALGDQEVTGTSANGQHVMSFGPTNVGIHAAAIEVELGKYGQALKLAKAVHMPDGYPPDRIGHHWIDTARAQLATGKNDAALTSLLKARTAAPQQAKYHPSVRETVAGLIHAARHTPETLVGYASWVGVQL